MGYGDFKLMSAIGAWLGWQSLPDVLLIASALGILFFFGYWLRSRTYNQAFAFGPF
ncbi:prepilin peptidase [Abyssogena phaseoliformis symbiont]|uniref:prepilin peptidase n=1 Tax=Abyssogena phaseoliformis symbiont TaxID=596095 RepID=UPI002479259B|nr:prepilin peptidase [Abyssogena phaseoliformis symbiont]